MGKNKKFQIISLDSLQLDLCRAYAKNCNTQGFSNALNRSQRKNKTENLNYQIRGLVGNLAGCVFFYGEKVGVEAFCALRNKIDLTPHRGDDGTDIPGLPIDIKTSKTPEKKDMMKMRLIVPKNEIHDNTFYVCCLLPHSFDENTSTSLDVHICGWRHTDNLNSLKMLSFGKRSGLKSENFVYELEDMSTIFAKLEKEIEKRI